MVIADDYALVREGIRAMLARVEDVEIVGEASDGQEAVELVSALRPDVLLIDLSMPGLNGIEALARISSSGVPTRVIVLSMVCEESEVQESIRRGARGFMLKGFSRKELESAIHAVCRGQRFLSSAVQSTLSPDVLDSLKQPPLGA